MWSTGEGGPSSALVHRVVAELEEHGLPLDRLRAAGGVVRTTIDAKAQTVAAAVVGRLVAARQGDPGAAVTAVDPDSGGVRVYLGRGRVAGPGGDGQEDLTPEIVRPFADAGAPNLVRGRMSPLEVTAAYAAFAAGGVRHRPHFVTSVTGADGSSLYQVVEVAQPAFDRQAADRVTGQLAEKPGCGGIACVPGAHPWTAGYTPEVAVTVFVGQAGAAVDADLARVVCQEFLASTRE